MCACVYMQRLHLTLCVDSALRLYGASRPAAGVSDSTLHTYLTTGGAVPEGVMQDVRADSNTASVLTRSWATDTLAATWRCVCACVHVHVHTCVRLHVSVAILHGKRLEASLALHHQLHSVAH